MKQIIIHISKWFRGKQDYLCLKQFALFNDLTHFELDLVFPMFHRREFAPGELVFEKGYPLEVIYFVESGALEVTGKLQGNQTMELTTGGYIGLIDMYHEKIRSSSARAVKDTVLLAISRTDLQEFIFGRTITGVKILHNVCGELSRSVFQVIEQYHRNNESN
ncbi:MAG: cyclic nucleotide-binding domain-containing protein [Candidatus Cloacimonetes bacterium]|nr:cyclic nucleotide-binding domain-containing protein [Candidatus Cloacimonadota bacterium]